MPVKATLVSPARRLGRITTDGAAALHADAAGREHELRAATR